MAPILRPVLRNQGLKNLARKQEGLLGRNVRSAFSTQSGDDTRKPHALAKLHLEDGTTLTATSFGCHKSVEGEVRYNLSLLRTLIFVLENISMQRVWLMKVNEKFCPI